MDITITGTTMRTGTETEIIIMGLMPTGTVGAITTGAGTVTAEDTIRLEQWLGGDQMEGEPELRGADLAEAALSWFVVVDPVVVDLAVGAADTADVNSDRACFVRWYAR